MMGQFRGGRGGGGGGQPPGRSIFNAGRPRPGGPSTGIPPQATTNPVDSGMGYKPRMSPGLIDPNQMATTQPVGPMGGSPMRGGNPMQQKQMALSQSMRRPPNPTGGRMPMRGGRGMRGGGRGMY